jgi:CheY-like chemotaxis protein
MPENLPVVLVIHNEDHEAAELQALLERGTGCKTLVTWSGTEALKLLRTNHFDVLVTDDYVPDIYVGDLIERASVLPAPPQVLVLGEDSTTAAVGQYQNLGMCTIVDRRRPRAILQAITTGGAWKRRGAAAPVKSSGGGSPQVSGAKEAN